MLRLSQAYDSLKSSKTWRDPSGPLDWSTIEGALYISALTCHSNAFFQIAEWTWDDCIDLSDVLSSRRHRIFELILFLWDYSKLRVTSSHLSWRFWKIIGASKGVWQDTSSSPFWQAFITIKEFRRFPKNIRVTTRRNCNSDMLRAVISGPEWLYLLYKGRRRLSRVELYIDTVECVDNEKQRKSSNSNICRIFGK